MAVTFFKTAYETYSFYVRETELPYIERQSYIENYLIKSFDSVVIKYVKREYYEVDLLHFIFTEKCDDAYFQLFLDDIVEI